MALFHTDSLALACTDVQAEKRWWIAAFGCKEAKVPGDWDCVLPSDVALRLPGDEQPTVLLSDKKEIEQAGYNRQNDHPVVFCNNVKKAHEYVRARNAAPGPVQDLGGAKFFEIRDPEGNGVEICEAP